VDYLNGIIILTKTESAKLREQECKKAENVISAYTVLGIITDKRETQLNQGTYK